MLTKAQAKYIQNLGHKKFRDVENVFVAEGPKLVEELLAMSNIRLHSLFGLREFAENHKGPIPVHIINSSDLERISTLSTPNEVVGIFYKPAFESAVYKGKISLMLDTLQDPGNLGSIIRTADWFGIKSIVCSKESADVFNPKVVQSTMGSIARVNVVYEDLEDFLYKNKSSLPPVYATTLNGRSIYEMEGLKDGIILVGNESKGISAKLQQLAAHKITIPRKGQAESLNAAVATGIVLAVLVK